MEWTVRQLAERAGISGRTLRHYHAVGLLAPDRIGANGYRYYGPAAVARLQRILLLRDTGMALAEIAAVLASARTVEAEQSALRTHLDQLRRERETVERRIHAVEHTLDMRRRGLEPRMDVMLDGFNDPYEDEVVERWGRPAYEAAHQWWHAKPVAQQRAWKADAEALVARWGAIHADGHAPDSATAQEHAAAHLAWFSAIPGTPTHAGDAERSRSMVRGMADLYATDAAFHEGFGGAGAARFVAEALRRYAGEH